MSGTDTRGFLSRYTLDLQQHGLVMSKLPDSKPKLLPVLEFVTASMGKSLEGLSKVYLSIGAILGKTCKWCGYECTTGESVLKLKEEIFHLDCVLNEHIIGLGSLQQIPVGPKVFQTTQSTTSRQSLRDIF